jgi:hypothetical protein
MTQHFGSTKKIEDEDEPHPPPVLLPPPYLHHDINEGKNPTYPKKGTDNEPHHPPFSRSFLRPLSSSELDDDDDDDDDERKRLL